MTGRFQFPRSARLLTSRDYMRVYQQGLRFSAPPLRFRAVRNGRDLSRLGLSVGRKVGGAVVRNRWKRAIREAFRLERHRLNTGWDIVASVDWSANRSDAAGVADAFGSLIEFLNRRDAGS